MIVNEYNVIIDVEKTLTEKCNQPAKFILTWS